MTFFRSRWVDVPPFVHELEPHALPAGFRAAGAAAGLKAEGFDVGVLSCDTESNSAARFTTKALKPPPRPLRSMTMTIHARQRMKYIATDPPCRPIAGTATGDIPPKPAMWSASSMK